MVPAALYKKVLRFIISPCYVSIGHKEYIPSGIPYLNVYKTIFSPFDANNFTKFNLNFSRFLYFVELFEVGYHLIKQVDLRRDENFGFLGFEFRRVQSLKGVWLPQYTPLLRKRAELLRKLKEEFRRLRSQPTEKVIEVINPILRGWINYFAWGYSGRCFYYIRNWEEKKVRRHLMRSRQRKGFGWKRWSSQWIYKELGLFDDYHVRRPKTSLAKAIPA